MINIVVEFVSRKTASYLSKKQSQVNEPVLNYGLMIIYNTMFIIVGTLLVSLALGNLYGSLIAILSFMVLRYFTGGYHLKESDWCVVLSVFLMTSIPFIHVNEFILNLITLIIMIIFAPKDIEMQLKNSANLKLLFKLVSIILVLINMMMLKSEVTSLTFFVQAILLLIPNESRIKLDE